MASKSTKSTTVPYRREVKRLALDLAMSAAWHHHEVEKLVKDVPREKAFAAIDHAMEDCKRQIEFYERDIAELRAAIPVLEGFRPAVNRAQFRVVKS